jgi:hypothetical protein
LVPITDLVDANVYRSQLAPIPDFIPLPMLPPSDAVATHTEGPQSGRAGRRDAGPDRAVEAKTITT